MSFTEDLLSGPPEEPLPGDCCGNGCNPCILDVYQDLLQKWKNNDNHNAACNNSVPVLSMTRYMPFQLVSILKLTNDTNIYRFQAVVVTDPADKATNDGEIELVLGKVVCLPGQHLMLRNSYYGELGKPASGEEIITRPYTPISVAALHDQGKFDVLIKVYDEGKMSAYVKRMKVGDITFWRGPYGSFTYRANSYQSILMLCAGTGVAPMYSIAQMIVADEQDDTIVRMIFACKSLQDILLRNEIRSLSSFWNFSADIFLSNDDSGKPLYGENLKFGRVGKDQVQFELDKLSKKKCLVLICGPDSFTESMENIVKTCGLLTEHVYIF